MIASFYLRFTKKRRFGWSLQLHPNQVFFMFFDLMLFPQKESESLIEEHGVLEIIMQ